MEDPRELELNALRRRVSELEEELKSTNGLMDYYLKADKEAQKFQKNKNNKMVLQRTIITILVTVLVCFFFFHEPYVMDLSLSLRTIGATLIAGIVSAFFTYLASMFLFYRDEPAPWSYHVIVYVICLILYAALLGRKNLGL